MCAEHDRGCAWIRNLISEREEREWPKLVWQDFVGLCALGALLAALFAMASGV